MNYYHSNICRLIQKHLTPDLLHPKYRSKNTRPYAGHCYVASEAAYHIFGKDAEYEPMHLNHRGSSHWFLARLGLNLDIWPRDPEGKRRYLRRAWVYTPLVFPWMLDLTFEQFYDLPNYTKATYKAFLTKTPSKRAQILIDRVLDDII